MHDRCDTETLQNNPKVSDVLQDEDDNNAIINEKRSSNVKSEKSDEEYKS